MEPVGVIGLGLLGTAIAERLLAAPYPVHVYNRTREKADPLIERGAVWCDNPLATCPVVVTCLYTTETVCEVLDQLGGPRSQQTLIDTTTGDPEQTQALGERSSGCGVDYLECPIAGSSDQTRRGEALAIVAGRREVFQAHELLIRSFAPRAYHVGSWGNAARMKLVNNLILGLNRVALAEGLAFAAAMKIPPADALEVLQQGNARSVAMDLKGRKMVEGDFTTQAKLSQHLKDVRLILAQAEAAGLSLPFSNLHRQMLQFLEDAGMGELDNSAIIEAYGIARS